MPGVVLVPPMSKSAIEELPEELRDIILRYIPPLYEAISKLLQSTDNNEFERNYEKMFQALLLFLDLTFMTMKEHHFRMLLKNYSKYASSQTKLIHVNTSLVEALVSANDVISNFIRLVLDPKTTDFVPKHSDVFLPYLQLLGYCSILVYVVDNEIDVDRYAQNVEKVIRKCQENTEIVESYVDTIEIDADPEARATLEKIKQRPF